MRSLVLNFHSGSFLPGASTVSLFSLTSLRPPPALLLASSAVPFPEIAPRHGHRRASFSLVRAASDQEPPPPGEVPEANDAEGTAASGEDEATASAESAEPKPRPDEDVAGDNSSSSSLSEKESTSRQQETEGDWDAAWASTRQKMEQQRKDAPPFSGRKQVVATKIGDGEYDIVEISADGSRQRRGDGAGSGGFGFADNGGERSARGQMMDREQQTVDLATTNKAFAALFALLGATLCFYVYIYFAGGITNGATRFQEMGQPTTYDMLPAPARPTPEDDLSV